jgi:formylglycine-generating enzyme required for sulfatase activity
MAGNVVEWASSLYKGYHYDATDGRENLNAEDYRVWRGGAFLDGSRGVSCVYRQRDLPAYRNWSNGFRVVVSLD